MFRSFAALLVPLLTLSSCGSGATEITLIGNDEMKFDKRQFNVVAGQPVELTIKNVGKMPKEAMGHNVVILNMGLKVSEWSVDLPTNGASMKNQYLPESMRDDVIAFSKVLGPGESQTIKFTAPEEKGSYPFVCTFPGHYTMMNGIMMVE